MATSTIALSDTAYTLVSSASDFIAQNISAYPVEYVFAASLPAANTVGGILFYGQAIQKSSGVPSDQLYCKAQKDTALMAVS